MFAALLGVASFHRACLLAQDFTHEPACRREIAPHRAAFVTSLSRWYIRRLLGNSPPFHPCLSAERRPRIVPYGTSSPYGLLPRNQGTASPFCLPLCVPERGRAREGATVQDYREIFLHGHGSQTSTHYGTVEYEDMSLLYEERTFVALFLFVTTNSFLLTKRSIF